MYRASIEGISVSKPYGDNHRYDFLVQHGQRLLRIQVKSTFKRQGAGSEATKRRGRLGYQVIIARPRHNKEKNSPYYSREEIDFVVCFIAPADVWYIIPVEKLGHRHAIRVFPHGKKQPFGGLYEEYLNAWNLLKQDDSSAAEHTKCESEVSQKDQNSSTTEYTSSGRKGV